MARRVLVEIVGDSTKLERAFQRSERSAKNFNRSITRGISASSILKAGVGIATVDQAVQAFSQSVRHSITAASDLNEQMAKTDTVFGKSADSIENWATTTASSFGISRRQALATASSFGALFTPLGLVGAESARQSQLLTQLGADLASFYNTNVQDALDAIRSGLVGEAEPLRRYGVLLSETRVAQQAMADTGKRNASQLTAQEKALARIKIIFQDTATAQGDFARTSDGLANQSRELKAQLDDLSTTVGGALIPVLTHATTELNNFFEAMRHHDAPSAAKSLVLGIANLWLDEVDLLIPGDAIQNIGLEKGKKFAQGFLEGATSLGFRDPKVTAAIAAGAERQRTAPTRKAEQRNRWFDDAISRQLDQVQDIKSVQGQIDALKKIRAKIQERIKVTKDITRRNTLKDQVRQINRQIAGDQEEIADEQTRKAEEQKQKKQDMVDAMFEQLRINIDRAGLTKTVQDDIKAWQKYQAAVRKQIKIQGNTLDLQRKLLESEQAIKDLREQQEKNRSDWAKFKPIDATKFVQSLGFTNLSPGQIRTLIGAVAGISRTGKLPPSRTAAFAGAGMTIQNANFYGVQNPAQMEDALAKRANARPQVRRGAR